MKRILLFSVLALGVASGQQQKPITMIAGKLLGHDGLPMPKAHVHLLKAGEMKPLQSTGVEKDGSYKVYTDAMGLLLVQYTGVNHQMHTVPFMAEKRETQKTDVVGSINVWTIDVKLAMYKYVDDLTKVSVIGDFNNFSFSSGKAMEKQPDDTYAAEFEAKGDKFKYQFVGIEKGNRSINGTQSDDYEYDGGGDYRSIVTPNNGKVRIVFDPKKLIRSPLEAQVRFKDPSSRQAAFAQIYEDMDKRQIAFRQAAMEFQKSGKNFSEFKYDASTDLQYLASQIKSEQDPFLRQVLLIAYLEVTGTGGKDPEILRSVLEEIPPESPLWSLSPSAIGTALVMGGQSEKADKYFEEFLAKNPNTTAKVMLLINRLMMADYMKQEEKKRYYYDLLVKNFADVPQAKAFIDRFSPDRKIAVGKAVPRFSFVSLEDGKTVYNNESLKGKVYMIDFWAVWCGPCVAEMENLHKAYEKFKDKNFQIMSLSFDQSPDDVAKFRKDKWKMPWLHSLIKGGFDSESAKQFEVWGIPKPILVDGEGKVIAMEADLRGQNLEKTLERVLGK